MRFVKILTVTIWNKVRAWQDKIENDRAQLSPPEFTCQPNNAFWMLTIDVISVLSWLDDCLVFCFVVFFSSLFFFSCSSLHCSFVLTGAGGKRQASLLMILCRVQWHKTFTQLDLGAQFFMIIDLGVPSVAILYTFFDCIFAQFCVCGLAWHF